MVVLLGVRIVGALGGGQRGEHDSDPAAGLAGLCVWLAVGGEFVNELFDCLESIFLVRIFSPAETEEDLHLHVLTKKIDGTLELVLVVVRIGEGAKLDLLDLDDGFVFLLLLFLLGLLVFVFPEVTNTAHGRAGIGGNLHKIQPAGLGHFQCLLGGEHAHLLAVSPNNTHFADTNAVVNADARCAIESSAERGAAQDNPGVWVSDEPVDAANVYVMNNGEILFQRRSLGKGKFEGDFSRSMESAQVTSRVHGQGETI